ncbi:MAG: DUF5996 family protein [Bacteroidota bacterium]
MITTNQLPSLTYDKWVDSRTTMHLILQIIGKAKLKLTTRKNHWWYITLHPSSRGISTYSIPLQDGLDTLDIHFDIEQKAVVLQASNGENQVVDLSSSPTIAQFYTDFMSALGEFGLQPDFVNIPLDMNIDKTFEAITDYNHYDWDSIKEFWKVMTWTKDVFQEFSGRFYGKTCPVHIYWHSLDLAVTRFSGKRLPNNDNKSGRRFERETYSHEQISAGFWAGDPKVPQPMYYCYTFPSPEGLDQERLSPKEALWIDSNGSPMASLSYQAVRESENPRETLLAFLESSYQAGAKRAKWNVDDLTTPPLSEV